MSKRKPTTGSWSSDARALLEMGAAQVDSDTVRGLLGDLEEMEHERDIAAQRWGEALRAREFSKQWYGVRLQQLRELADAHGLTKEHCNIVANGAVSMHAPPTHAQQLNMAIYRAEKAEEELALLKLERAQGG